MPLKLTNSLSKQKEIFQPLVPGEVRMYVCGPTVYDEPHIGHLRSAYAFEMMRRYLQSSFCKYKVTFVRNVTDVDDKIIEKAKQDLPADLKEAVARVSKTYFDMYKSDLSKMGITEPSVEPKATEHISEMIQLIERLIEKGAAYPSEGDVYFDVPSFG